MTHDDELAQLRAENAGLTNLLHALGLVVKELLRIFPVNGESESIRRVRATTDEILARVEQGQRPRGGHGD
jgi:hypothetical protein